MDSESLFDNFTDSDFNHDYENVIQMDVTGIVVNSVILYIGLCANIWMIWSLCKTWQSGSRLHLFLLPLSVADILTLCFRCGTMIGLSVTFFWEGGYYACNFVMMAITFGSCLAHLILASLNVDNAITIIRNISSKLLRHVLLLVSLMVTIVASILKGLSYELYDGVSEKMKYCTLRQGWGDFPTIYIVVFEILHNWLPFLIVLLFGIITLCTWCAVKGKRQYEKIEGAEQEELKTIGRVVSLTLVFDLFFLLCWGFGSIAQRVFMHTSYTTAALILLQVTQYTAPANSLINPFIYAVFCCINKKRQKVSPGL